MISYSKYSLSKSRGISLIEIMVGVVIGMLGVLVIYQVFAETEARKRTTTGTNDAQENGFFAILSMERDIRQAGHGYTSFPGAGGNNPAIGCNVRAYNQNATPQSINFRLIPILITDGGTGLSDAITVTYSTSSRIATPVPFDMPTGNAANYAVTNIADRAGFEVGDLVLATQPGLDCSLAQITEIPGNANLLIHNPGVNGNFNKPGGLGVDYSAPNAQLLNLGNPTIVQYFLSAVPHNNLSVSDLKLGNVGGAGNTVTLADQIVNLQAQYGIDTNNDNSIDGWVEPTGPIWGDTAVTPVRADIMLIKAVRLAVVARSARMEGKETGEACTTTTVAPVAWNGGPSIDLSANPDWRCYRYKVFQTIIPLRNMIWGGAS